MHTPEPLVGTLHPVHSLAHILAPQVHIPEHQACTLEPLVRILEEHQAHTLGHQECHPVHRECTLPLGSPQVVADLNQLHPRVDLALGHRLRLEALLLL